MKNYYEILEIDKKASSEMIEKAYKILAKRYHPDLKNNKEKQIYEEKMKEINEAYSVLSDDYKKTTYDNQLKSTTVKREEYDKIVKENIILKQQLERILSTKTNNVQNNNSINNMNRILKDQIKRATTQARQEAYTDAYVDDMKNRGYQIKYKHDFKYYLKLVGLIIITIIFLFLIYQIPIVKDFCNNLYKENLIFRTIVNIFKNTITTGF